MSANEERLAEAKREFSRLVLQNDTLYALIEPLLGTTTLAEFLVEPTRQKGADGRLQLGLRLIFGRTTASGGVTLGLTTHHDIPIATLILHGPDEATDAKVSEELREAADGDSARIRAAIEVFMAAYRQLVAVWTELSPHYIDTRTHTFEAGYPSRRVAKR